MTPVTVDAAARDSYYSAGNIGWSARCLFAYRHLVSQQVYSAAVQSFGNSASLVGVGQSFTTGSDPVRLDEIVVLLHKVGSPTDNVICELHSGSGSTASSTILATSTFSCSRTSLPGTSNWISFPFSPNWLLAPNTKYWFVFLRTGGIDASNYYQVSTSTSSSYSGGGRTTYNGSSWGADNATTDICFQVLQDTPLALYRLTQDTSLHMWKSTDGGASWSEVDSANKPTVASATSPFSACNGRAGPYIGVVFFTATNTINVRYFNMATDLWSTANYGTSPPTAVSNQKSIRINFDDRRANAEPGGFVISYVSSADDCDINSAQVIGSGTAYASTATAILALTSTEKSTLSDQIGDKSFGSRQHRFYYDCLNDDFSYRSILAPTQGTEGDVDATAADIDTEHANSTYEIYQASGVDTAIIAFIDADGTLEERIATLEAATPTFASQNQVSSDIGAAGRQLSSCRFNGINYIFGCDGTNIDMHNSSSAGSWSSTLSWLTGTASAVTLSQAIPVIGGGVLVAYTDNGDAKVEWAVVVTNVTGTITGDSAALTGQSITAGAGATGSIEGVIDTKGIGNALSNNFFGMAGGGNHLRMQTFKVYADSWLDSIVAYPHKMASFSGIDGLEIAIYAFDGTNAPTGSALGVSSTVADSALVFNPAFNYSNPSTFTFATPVPLAAGVVYGAVIRRTGAGDDTNYYSFQSPSNLNSNYADGDQYFSNASDVWAITSPVRDTAFVFSYTTKIPLVGQAIEGTGESVATGDTGTVAFDSAPLTGVAVTGSAGSTGSITQDSIPSSGQVVAGVTGSAGVVTQDSIPSAGQVVAGVAGSVGAVTEDSIASAGQAVAGVAGSAGLITQDSIPSSGQAVTGVSGSVGTVTEDSLPLAGQALAGVVHITGAVTEDSIASSGQAVAGVSGSVGAVTQDSLPISGQVVAGVNGSAAVITEDTIPIDGQAVAGVSGTVAGISPDSAPVAGQTITAINDSNAVVTGDTIPMTGQGVDSTLPAIGTLTEDTIPITGQAVAGVAHTDASVSPDFVPINGQSVTGVPESAGVITPDVALLAGQVVAGITGSVGGVVQDSIPATGQAITSVNDSSAVVTADLLPLAGQIVSGQVNEAGTITPDAIPVAGQGVAGLVDFTGLVTADSLATTGIAVTATAGVIAIVDGDILPISGNLVEVGATGDTGQVAPDQILMVGQSVTGVSGSLATVVAQSVASAGLTVVGEAGSTGTISPDVLSGSGQTVTGSFQALGSITGDDIPVVPVVVVSVAGTVATVTEHSIPLVGVSVTGSGAASSTVLVNPALMTMIGQSVLAASDSVSVLGTNDVNVLGQDVSGQFNTVAVIIADTIGVIGTIVLSGLPPLVAAEMVIASLRTFSVMAQYRSLTLTATIRQMSTLAGERVFDIDASTRSFELVAVE